MSRSSVIPIRGWPGQNALSGSRPHKCTYCKALCFDFQADDHSLEPYNLSRLMISTREVVHAARNGCMLLQWLLALLQRDPQNQNHALREHGLIEITITLKQVYKTELIPHGPNQDAPRRLRWEPRHILMNYGQNQPFARYKYQAACSPYYVHFMIEATSSAGVQLRGSESLSFYRGHSLTEDLADETTCIFKTSKIEWNKSSPRSMRFAATCLSECRQSDSDCKPLHHLRVGYLPRLPTRLIYVLSASSTGCVRLVETSQSVSNVHTSETYPPTKIEYAVLSYCWGGPQAVTLTGGTLSYLLRGFPINQLGQTIQDAIRVCNELNIPYLWVDSLCILQSGDQDKQHELSMMSTYYQEGVLTICAASAKSSTEGFLQSKEEDAYEIGPFQSTFTEGTRVPTRSAPGHLRYGAFHDFTNAEKKEMDKYPFSTKVQLFKLRNERPIEPITSRAWTFQEALLSTRTLIFATNQVYWCCRERYIGCGGAHSFEKVSVVHEDCPGLQSVVCACGISLIRQIEPSDIVPGMFTLASRSSMSTDAQWDMLVSNFSGRALSEPLDKLIAFSAAASYFDELFRARWPSVQYTAGLWYSVESPLPFIRQLLWSSVVPTTATRSSVYRAPTWSWACLEGQVNQFERSQMLYHYRTSLKVLRLHTELSVPTAEFGAIKSSVLLLHGKLRSLAPFEGNGMVSSGQSPVPGMLMLPDTKEDEDLIAFNLGRIYLLEAAPYNSRVRSPVGIILCQLDDLEEVVSLDVPTFKRMGTFVFSMDEESLAADIFDGCLEEEMYIV